VKYILAKDSNFPVNEPVHNFYKTRLLHVACCRTKVEIVSLLIKSGGSVNATMHDGSTPLHQACQFGSSEIVRELLVNGADINATRKDGDVPLILACAWARGEVVLEVLEHVSKTQSRDDFRALLEKVKEWALEYHWNSILSSLLTSEVMDSMDCNLWNNMANNEKGAR